MHCTAILCSAVMRCTSVLHSTALQCPAQLCQYCSALNWAALHCTALHWTALHWTWPLLTGLNWSRIKTYLILPLQHFSCEYSFMSPNISLFSIYIYLILVGPSSQAYWVQLVSWNQLKGSVIFAHAVLPFLSCFLLTLISTSSTFPCACSSNKEDIPSYFPHRQRSKNYGRGKEREISGLFWSVYRLLSGLFLLTFWNVLRHFEMFWDIFGRFENFWYGSGQYEMFWDNFGMTLGCFETFGDVLGFTCHSSHVTCHMSHFFVWT